MALKKVWIEKGCTACVLCVDIFPQVFKMANGTAAVRKDVHLGIEKDSIKEAAGICPEEVIHYEE